MPDAHQILRVPAEQLAQTCRKQHKLVEKELSSAIGEIHEVLKDSHVAPSSMNRLVDRLQGLKRKVEHGQVQEDELLQRCRMRLDYLQQMHQRDANPKSRDSAQTERLQRLVADYLLREGYDNSARCLAEEAGLERYLDFEQVLASRDVLAALQVRARPHLCTRLVVPFPSDRAVFGPMGRRGTASRPWRGVPSISPS